MCACMSVGILGSLSHHITNVMSCHVWFLGGYFARMAIEVPSAARAQVAGGQEFADFNTSLGIGTYATQMKLLHLPTIDRELGGFEGAFSANTSHGHYGFIVPYHNRVRFFGKLVRVDLFGMENITDCMLRVRFEKLDANGVSSAVYIRIFHIVILLLYSCIGV
jgi:hypothetical protein